MQQREGMRTGAQRRHPVGALSFEVGRPGEPCDVGGAGSGDGSLLVGATRAHLDQRAAFCCVGHPGGGRRDCRVVIEDRQCQRLQDDAFAECAVHGQHRGAGEVQFALGVSVDVAAESIVGEVGQRLAVAEVRQRRQYRVVERELRQRFHESSGSGDHAVPAAFGQPSGEHLERRSTVRGSVAQGGREHRQLVLVGE